MNTPSQQAKKIPTLVALQGRGVSESHGVSVMQKINPENIFLFTSKEGIYFSPLVSGEVSNGYLVPWGEIKDLVERIESLVKSKHEFDNGEFPF